MTIHRPAVRGDRDIAVLGRPHGWRRATGLPWPFAGWLVSIAALVPLHAFWGAQLLLIPLLLIVPGVILLRALRIPGRVVSSFPVYVPCASIIVLFAVGLAANFIGPLVSVSAPLRTVPLLVAFEVVCFALLACSLQARVDVSVPWHSILRPARIGWLLVVPLVAAAGAVRLNTGHTDALAVTRMAPRRCSTDDFDRDH